MKKIIATHYICIKSIPKKGEEPKDKLVIRSGEIRGVTDAEYKMLEQDAPGRWVDYVELKQEEDADAKD